MFKLLRITKTDGSSITCEGRKADIVRFERRFKGPIGIMFTDEGFFAEHMWFFGWCAEKRINPDIPEFDEWIEDIESVEVIEEADENPSDPSPSPSA